MTLGLRFIAALLSPFLAGLYAAWLTYAFRDPARPFALEEEYLLGALFALSTNVIALMWLSIGIDNIVKRKAYFVKFIIYSAIGFLPVIIDWLTSSNPEKTLFYPQATFFPLVSLFYFHVLLGLDALKHHRRKH